MENDDIMTMTVEQLRGLLKDAFDEGYGRGATAARNVARTFDLHRDKDTQRSQCVEGLMGQIL